MNNSSDYLILVRWHSSLYTAIHGLLGIGITGGANTLKQRAKLPHILDLTGPELLRLLVEKNCAILSSWCPQCLTFIVKSEDEVEFRICPGCGSERFFLDDQFWRRASQRIRRAVQSDEMLLRTVKAEWESIREGNPKLPSPPYPFPTPLSWINGDWTKARPPSNRPLETRRFYRLSFMIERLRDLGLTQAEILDVLNGSDFPDGPVTVGDRDYANIRGEDLKGLSEIFWKSVGPPPDPAELWRIMQGIRHRKGSLLTRLSGEKIKQAKAFRGAGKSQLPRSVFRPTELDEFRFKMVSVLVRQESYTREDAAKRVAELQGLPDGTVEILSSLDRVWQYTSALIVHSGGQMPEPEEFWKPGCLKNKLATL